MAKFIKDFYDKFREDVESDYSTDQILEDNKGLTFEEFIKKYTGNKSETELE